MSEEKLAVSTAHERPSAADGAADMVAQVVARIAPVGLDARLAEAPFLAGDAYSIADVATYPWAKMAGAFVNEGDLPHLKRWLDTIAARPATQRLAELDLKTPSTQRG